jgi:hypothetical protein
MDIFSLITSTPDGAAMGCSVKLLPGTFDGVENDKERFLVASAGGGPSIVWVFITGTFCTPQGRFRSEHQIGEPPQKCLEISHSPPLLKLHNQLQ